MDIPDLEARSVFPPALTHSENKGLRQRIGSKRLILLVAFLAVCAAAWYLYRAGKFDPAALMALAKSHPAAAIWIFVGIYAVSVLTALPTLPLNLAAGMLWGSLLGGSISTVGAGTGAMAAFFSARVLFGQPLARRFDARLVTWLQEQFDNKGWQFIAFLRLNPVFPTGPLNYILGLTSISAGTYAWATYAFLALPSILVALIGSEMGSLAAKGAAFHWMRTVIVISMAATLLIATRYGAKSFSSTRRNSK